MIGVGKFNPNNRPVGLTNTLKDFNKSTASTNTSEIDSYKVPVVLVIKKNYRTLSNLIDWLSDNSASGDQGQHAFLTTRSLDVVLQRHPIIRHYE